MKYGNERIGSVMYGNVKRDKEYTARLLDFVKQKYGLDISDITPAKRGYYGETWRLDNYFAKLDYSYHKEVYRKSIPVVEFMCDAGIDSISRPVKSLEGHLCSDFEDAVLGLFYWIEGDNVQNYDSRTAEYRILSNVYSLPAGNLNIQRQRFDSSPADLFFELWGKLSYAPLINVFKEYRANLENCRERLVLSSHKCAEFNGHFYITHGDAGSNIIKGKEKYYLVDWDGAVIAPPERDAWFYMHLDGEIEKFNDELKRKGINYAFRSERLAYACYRAYFEYLNNFMDTHFEIGNNAVRAESLKHDYFEGWLKPIVEFADKIIL